MSDKISSLTEDTAPDQNDFVVTSKGSAIPNRKVRLSNVGGIDVALGGVVQKSAAKVLDFRSGTFAITENSDGSIDLGLLSPGGQTVVVTINTTDFKDAADIVATGNLTLSGEQTIDGVLTSASRVLVIGQTNKANNGWYTTAAGAWSRTTDADTSAEVTSGALTYIESGTLGTGKIYVLTTPDPITLGSTLLNFSEVALPTNNFVGKTVSGTTYTLVGGDASKRLNATNASAKTITIPANSGVNFPVNTELEFCNIGAGVLTVAGSGFTPNSLGGRLTVPQYNCVKVKKRANPNTWEVTGVVPFVTESFVIAASDETTALTTGTAKVTFRMPYAFTVTDVRASVTTAPTGGTLLTVDVNETGTTILSTKLTFDASEKTTTTAATPRVISDTALADDAEMTVDIDAVGSTIAGAGLKVYLIGHQ